MPLIDGTSAAIDIGLPGLVSQFYASLRTILGSPALQYAFLQISLIRQPPSPIRDIPTARLAGYGEFQGTVLNHSLSGAPLPQSVTAWLGMEYANQPIGPERFAAVHDPDPFDGVRAADTFGKTCIQVARVDGYEEAEDCLSFNVFKPANFTGEEKLPVFVWIHGGAFQAGSSRSFDGASFVAASKEALIAVTFQYRLTALGFLPAPFFASLGIDNLGFRDQHHFLKFLQVHVASFGGDPDSITLGGLSAGAHSVGFNYQNVLPSGKKLFSRAVLQSGGPTARTFPGVDYPLYQQHYHQFLIGVGCDGLVENVAVLSCLKSAASSTIRNVSAAIWAEGVYNIRWPFQPLSGGFMMEKPGSERWEEGNFNHLPVLTSSTTDEARFYAPLDLNTTSDFTSFLHNLYPGLTEANLETLEELYPSPDIPSSPYGNSTVSPQYSRVSAALSDSFYICSSQETATRLSDAGVPAYKLHWDVADDGRFPPYMGVPHSSDLLYTWNAPGVQFPHAAHALHAYLASFALTGDPNKLRYEGTPEWPRYAEAMDEIVINRQGVSTEKDDIRREACEFWRSIPKEMKH